MSRRRVGARENSCETGTPSMKAVVYRGPRDVRVEDVPDPKIEWPTDVLVRVTSTNICGSDLHMYEGRTDLESGQIIGQAGSIPAGTRVVAFDVGGGNDRDSGVSDAARKANRGKIEARIRAAGAKPVFVAYPRIVGPQNANPSAWIAGDPHHHITAQSHRRVAAAILPSVIAAIGKK